MSIAGAPLSGPALFKLLQKTKAAPQWLETTFNGVTPTHQHPELVPGADMLFVSQEMIRENFTLGEEETLCLGAPGVKITILSPREIHVEAPSLSGPDRAGNLFRLAIVFPGEGFGQFLE